MRNDLRGYTHSGYSCHFRGYSSLDGWLVSTAAGIPSRAATGMSGSADAV